MGSCAPKASRDLTDSSCVSKFASFSLEMESPNVPQRLFIPGYPEGLTGEQDMQLRTSRPKAETEFTHYDNILCIIVYDKYC